MVTFTVFWVLAKLPSAIFATAITSCVPARRIRVLARCAPAPSPKLNVATPGVGLPAASTMIAVAPSALTSIGTVLPFSAISGASRSTPPSATSAPPVNSAIASSVSDAIAGIGNAVTAAAAAPIASVSRRVNSIFISLVKLVACLKRVSLRISASTGRRQHLRFAGPSEADPAPPPRLCRYRHHPDERNLRPYNRRASSCPGKSSWHWPRYHAARLRPNDRPRRQAAARFPRGTAHHSMAQPRGTKYSYRYFWSS